MFIFYLFLLAHLSGVSFSQELPTVEITPPLSRSSSLSLFDANLSESSSSPSLGRKIFQGLALPVTSYGAAPGSATQIRGLGLSAEDTQVSSLGISLNGPQGGGFDFSTFPLFLWDQAVFSLENPKTGARDPRSNAGHLTLIPWTEAHLKDERKTLAWFLTSQLGVSELAVGGATKWSPVFATSAVMGASFGRQSGPSGSAGLALTTPSRLNIQFHLLGTDTQSDSPGSQSLPTPNALFYRKRLLTLLSVEKNFFYTSVYGDWGDLRYVEPDASIATHDLTQQQGVQLAYDNHTRLIHTDIKKIRYTSLTFGTRDEWVGSLSWVSRLERFMSLESWTLSPKLGFSGVSALGFFPDLGLKSELRHDEHWSSFVNLSWTPRFPSLVDRFYEASGFLANPDLKPESVYSLQVGGSFSMVRFMTQLQWVMLYRPQATLTTTTLGGLLQVQSQGEAWVQALIWNLKLLPLDFLEVISTTHLTWSRVIQRAQEFPFLSRLTQSFGARWFHSFWELSQNLKSASSFLTGYGPKTLPSYVVLDVNGAVRFKDTVKFSLGVENAFDHPFQLVPDYPMLGFTAYLNLRIEI